MGSWDDSGERDEMRTIPSKRGTVRGLLALDETVTREQYRKMREALELETLARKVQQ